MGVENPDWLPVGWKVCVKVRSCGKKDKYYVNPSKGLKFNSKPEVLRYLKTSRKDRKPKEPNEVDIEKTVAEKLPPGWIKEIRIKKKGSKTRRDPYYIDPVSGRHFRSMQEVFRYLESKDSEKAKSEPDDKNHSQSSSAEAKRHKRLRSMDKKADKVLTEHESIKSGPELASGLKGAIMNNVNVSKDNYFKQREEDDSLAIELSDKLQLVNGAEQFPDRTTEIRKSVDRKADKGVDGDQRLKSGSKVSYVEQKEREGDYVDGKHPNKLPEVNGKERHEVGRRQSRRLTDSKLKDNVIKDRSLKSGSEGDAVTNINMLETNGIEQREKENNSIGQGEGCKQESPARQNKRKQHSNSKWTSDLPRRTSKRLAQIEVDPSLEVKTSKKPRPLDEPAIYPTKRLAKSNPNTIPTKCNTTNRTDSKQQKPVSLPLENEKPEKQHLDSKEEPEKQHLDSSLNDLLMDPCIEFAIKTLTGAIPIEDLKKVGESPVSSSRASPSQTSASSSILPCGDIWADPCFEFAVKTLTGDAPMDTLPKFRLDHFYPSNYSVTQIDGVMKPYVRQQGVRDPTSLPINGSSKNFGLHQGVEGRNGNFV